jgi:hypothetical protein
MELKRQLAERFSNDREAYTRGKEGFIARICTQAKKHDGRRECGRLVSDDEELAVVLGVELAVGADGDGSVCGANG